MKHLHIKSKFHLPSIYPCLFILTTVISLFHGCSSDTPSMPVSPVIEGWFDSDGHPVVMFTTTVSPDNKSGTFDDKMIQWGRVAISDGTVETVLTGGVSDDFFPPHRYYTTEIKGTPGKTYTLTADYRDMHVTSTATMPFPTSIDSITIAPIESNDTLRAVTLHLTAPTDVPAYYYLTVSRYGDNTRALPSMLGNAVATIAGEHIEIPVMLPKNRLDINQYIAQPAVGDRLIINLNRVEEPIYDFWRDFDNMIMFGNSQFVSNDNSLRSNIVGGFGVWSPQGTSTARVEIK